MKINQIIFETTQLLIGNKWFTIESISSDGTIRFEGGTWTSYDTSRKHLDFGTGKIPDSDFRYYRGEKIDLLNMSELGE